MTTPNKTLTYPSLDLKQRLIRFQSIKNKAEGFVSITPLQLDLTAYRASTDLSTWHWDVEANHDLASQIAFSDQPLELKTKE